MKLWHIVIITPTFLDERYVRWTKPAMLKNEKWIRKMTAHHPFFIFPVAEETNASN